MKAIDTAILGDKIRDRFALATSDVNILGSKYGKPIVLDEEKLFFCVQNPTTSKANKGSFTGTYIMIMVNLDGACFARKIEAWMDLADKYIYKKHFFVVIGHAKIVTMKHENVCAALKRRYEGVALDVIPVSVSDSTNLVEPYIAIARHALE